MASTVGHQTYDENLLASAPVATKAQLQSGYNPDLLVEKHTPPPSRQDRVTPAPARDGRELESQTIPSKEPFYRTKKGIIIIFVVIIVIIAVVVGGAVGGSKKKNNKAITLGNGQSGGSQGGSPAPSSNSTSSTSSASASAADSQVVGAPGPNPTSASDKASTTISNPNTFSFTLPIIGPTAVPTAVNQEVGLFSGFS